MSRATGSISENELRSQAGEFLNLLRRAFRHGGSDGINGAEGQAVRDMLGSLSRNRGAQGFSPSETASFVFSLKRPILSRLRTAHGRDVDCTS